MSSPGLAGSGRLGMSGRSEGYGRGIASAPSPLPAGAYPLGVGVGAP